MFTNKSDYKGTQSPIRNIEFTRLQNSVFPVMLIANSEQFPMFLSCAKPELHLCGEAVWLKAQRILDVALWFEGGGDSGSIARGASKARKALTPRLRETAHTDAMLPTAECCLLVVAHLVGLRTS